MLFKTFFIVSLVVGVGLGLMLPMQNRLSDRIVVEARVSAAARPADTVSEAGPGSAEIPIEPGNPTIQNALGPDFQRPPRPTISFQNFRGNRPPGIRRQLRTQRIYFTPSPPAYSCGLDPSDQPSSQPAILENYPLLTYRTLKPASSNEIVDLCACGYAENTSLSVSLLNPHGDVITHISASVERSLPVPRNDLTNYCYASRQFRAFDFGPEAVFGDYTIAISGGNTILTHTFELKRLETPLLYYSGQSGGYVLAGFGPFEKVQILAYEPVGYQYSGEEWSFTGEGQLELDQDGVGLLVDIEPDIEFFVLGQSGIVERDRTQHGGRTIFYELPVDDDNPADARAYYYLGLDAYTVDDEIANYTKALELDPTYYPAYFQLGELYNREGNQEAAIENYSQAIAIAPNYAVARYKRAELYQARGDYDAALADYSQIIELAPDSLIYYERAYYERGEVYRQQQNIVRAVADFERYLEIETEQSVGQNAEKTLAELRAKLPPCDEAVLNGDMESDEGWIVDLGALPAQYVKNPHSGEQSLWVGLPSGKRAWRPLWSSARQRIDLPAGRPAALSFWYLLEADAAPGRDLQIVALLDQRGRVVELLKIARENTSWQQFDRADLSTYTGQTIYLYFGVINDGFGGAARMLVDEVSVCVE